MGFSLRIAQLMFKGALASYLLLYALDFRTRPDIWTRDISSNILIYCQYILGNSENYEEVVGSWLSTYSQWLVVVSLMIIATNFRTGMVLGWLTILVNTLLCWNQTEWLFIGIHVILLSTIFS